MTAVAVLDQLLAVPPRDPADEAILDAALDQFCLLGVRRTSIDDVARSARINRVTVYRRIGTKDALVSAVITRELQRLVGAVQSATREIPEPQQRLAEALVVTLRTIRGHALLRQLLTVDRDELLPRITLNAAPLIELGAAFVATQIQQGYSDLGAEPTIDVTDVAEIIARLIQSFVLTPEIHIRLSTDAQVRQFATTHLLPLIIRS